MLLTISLTKINYQRDVKQEREREGGVEGWVGKAQAGGDKALTFRRQNEEAASRKSRVSTVYIKLVESAGVYKWHKL